MHSHSLSLSFFLTFIPPELVVLVDFKAIYPGVPQGVFASFPGVAHFLSFEQICQYPRESRKSTSYPGVLFLRGRPRGNPNYPGVCRICSVSSCFLSRSVSEVGLCEMDHSTSRHKQKLIFTICLTFRLLSPENNCYCYLLVIIRYNNLIIS